MVYKPNIPTPEGAPAVQYADVQENFSQLDTVMGVDHYAYSAGEPYVGMHKAVRFMEQSTDPDTIDEQIALYAKDNPDGDLSWYVRGPNNGRIIQITGGGSGNNFNRPGLAAAVRFDYDANILGTSDNVASIVRTDITGSGSVRLRFRYTITFTSAIPLDCYISLTYDLNGTKQNTLAVNQQTTALIEVDVLQAIPASTPLFDQVECIVWRPSE